MNQDRLLQVILAPVVTEKSARVGEKSNQYVFKVMPCATKPDIKAAVELCFDVKVTNVNTINYDGKVKRFGRFVGRRKNWKKAYVTLATGSQIQFATP